MAFQSNAQRSNTSAPANDSWKSQGFINFYLPKPDGTRGKLGAIGLKDSRPAEKKLLEFLNSNPEAVKTLMAKLIVEYRPATPDDTAGFDLS